MPHCSTVDKHWAPLPGARPDPPRSRDTPFRRRVFRLALLWLPALNVVTIWAVASIAGIGDAVLIATAVLVLAELALLAVRSRHNGISALEVAVAIIGTAVITITVLLLLVTALIAIRCPDCNGLS